jgi:hypothetical protein
MKTTIDIPDQMLREAMKNAGADTKREAVLQALDDFNRKYRQRKLVKYLGTFKSIMTHRQLMKLRQNRVTRDDPR